MYDIMGFREGILILPNGRKLPVNIDYCYMRSDCIPEIRISVIPGVRGRIMIEDSDCRERSKYYRPFALPPINPMIKNVIFNDPATIVLWKDGTKTVVKCQEGDTYSKELGLAMCISKKYLGNKGNFNEVFKKWIPDETPYTEEELSQLLQNIDFSKIGEALGDILYNFGKSLIEIYGPTPEPTAENQEPEEDLDIEPIEPEPEDITNKGLTKALYSYCGTTPCKDCKIPKDEKGNCESIESMGREELINTYKAIKK